jgi:NAD(P)-dependent dehydrogenase (short-subunit alcohol dehydrogenase family)
VDNRQPISPGEDAYRASKAGVYGLIGVMATDYARHAIRVNGVLPAGSPLQRGSITSRRSSVMSRTA